MAQEHLSPSQATQQKPQQTLAKKCELVVISHTHWDREWYLPFQEFRWKLVKLMDDLLDVLGVSHQGPAELDRAHPVESGPFVNSVEEGRPEFRCFMLDGQTILLEDYLELRPDRREELRRLISSGRILVGPWYVLPDEFLVSGEALIRNLLMGDSVASEYGDPMGIGYLPDQFGHIAQMPQILRGFGLDSAVIWRGIGDEPGQTEFLWRAPDGSEVLTLHLPHGYFNGQSLPTEPEEFLERIARIRRAGESRTKTGHLLIMNGGDHQFVQTDIPAVLEAARERLADAELVHGCLPHLMADIREVLNASGAALPVVKGELRNSKRAHLLPGVFSSRMWIKQRNARCENLLEKWAEPLSAWALVEGPADTAGQGREYGDLTASAAGAALRLAWKYLLQNHPHDSICGCSVDQVHDEMRTRYNWSDGIAEGVARQAMEQIANQVNTASISGDPYLKGDGGASRHSKGDSSDKIGAPVGYSCPTQDAARDGRAQDPPTTASRREPCVVVFNPVDGPRTDFVTLTVKELDEEKLAVLDSEGNTYPCQILQRRANPVNCLPEMELGFLTPDVPGFGYKAYKLVAELEPPPYREIAVTARSIENEHFLLEVDAETGTLQVLDKLAGRRYKGLNQFVDGGDAGDEYNYDAPPNDLLVRRPSEAPKISLAENGPGRFTLRIESILPVPKELAEDRRSRQDEVAKLPVTSYVTLYPGVRRIDIHTEVDNLAKDHRLRVHFPTGVDSDFAYADSHFAVERRSVDLPSYSADWVEDPVGTHLQKSYVDVNDGIGGLAVANRGLPEYEVIRSDEGLDIALTLLRCVGWLSREDLRSRRGPAGPNVPAPGAQCPGRHTFDYSLIPHPCSWPQVSSEARRFNSPLRAQQTYAHPGRLPNRLSFVEVEPGDLVLSTVKPAEGGDGVIVRLYNPLSHSIRGRISIHRPFLKAELVDLREEPIGPLANNGNSVSLEVSPSQIVTIRFDFEFGAFSARDVHM